ncbi:MAG: UDP-N-acetylmuramate dehydrogenase [Candidatus Daviesbacteria bacterium]|nr:UDP-N-acetylmuramate dehydrogenase [Candidatus Daviesbacteria bacterium]
MLKFKDNYPMSQITTLQIGGPAKKFVKVKTEEELIEAIKYAKDQLMSYLIIGGGSNLLVSDEGIDCLVIKNEVSGIEETHLRGEEMLLHLGGVMLSVKSGTLLQDFVDYTIENEFSGLQKLTGIPGTVGGAVYGNAGAYGQTISDHIISVVILSEAKNITTLSKEECQFNYRDSIFKQNHDIILEVTFKLESGDPEALQQEVKEILAKRLVKYPPGIKCPGSFFKNIVAETLPKDILDRIQPEKIVYGKLPAGVLLEAVRAKGKLLDGIEISPNHANLFINTGGGTAKAFCELAKQYAQKVKEKFGITLEPEVQLINLPLLN